MHSNNNLLRQISEPCPSPHSSRSERIMKGGGGGNREQAPLQGAAPKSNQKDMIRAGPDNALILMLKSAQHVIITGRTARPVSVQVPVNPALYLHVYPLDEDVLDGATAGVYKFRTQQFF